MDVNFLTKFCPGQSRSDHKIEAEVEIGPARIVCDILAVHAPHSEGSSSIVSLTQPF